MPKLNRAYKKGGPHRDARLFVIVAEGEREDKYFKHFNAINQRVQIQLIEREAGASAPKHFTSRLEKAEQAGDYSASVGDQIWFVCDIDRWRDQLHELIAECEQRDNWHIAISNPCFEVWLHCHAGPLEAGSFSCRDLKGMLPQTALGGFDTKSYCPEIEKAIGFAQQADSMPDSYLPEPMQTKVYKLAKEMCQLLGSNWH